LQFSVTEHFREAIGYPRPPPGVYFFYEFSPIKVMNDIPVIILYSQKCWQAFLFYPA